LFSQPRYQVEMKAKDADSNALASTLLSKPDTLFGPLGLDASLRATWAATRCARSTGASTSAS
jgi:hypothetical protein